ncbi:MAG TPA: helix-turn-helix domain-containing protein, partial [Chloroflexota bacterium]|nr:helix-turn-helix domain-containing protein [Chloroflexota bacterium]
MTINRDSAFGDLLRRCRLAAGLTQEELAERSGVSPRGIGDLERGIRRVPHLNTVRLLAGALGLGDAEREHFVSMARRRASREEAGPTSSDDARVASPTALPHDWSTGMTGRFERESRPDDISPRHNLPTQLTSFIGRERELAEIADQLSGPKQVRLLTLVGAGGCGKTRLALQAGATLLATYPDGVWMAELAALNDPDLVVPTVAAVLGIQSLASTPILDQLVDALKDRRLLVILDNCEHVIGACASLADTLLRGCRTTQILATSREALRIAGEVVWRVPSLSLPTFAEASTLATRRRDPVDWLTPGSLPPRIVASDWVRELEQTEAVQLFVERARAVAPDFVLTASNIAEVVRICYLLDGIPLALELAAARVRMLPVDEIATRLDQSLDLLTGGSRVALPRQQTLRATLVWSYELLTDAERALFNRLAVFVGGFTLEAVEAVCGDDLLPDILDLLTQVLDRSLIEIEPRAVSPRRYRLL